LENEELLDCSESIKEDKSAGFSISVVAKPNKLEAGELGAFKISSLVPSS